MIFLSFISVCDSVNVPVQTQVFYIIDNGHCIFVQINAQQKGQMKGDRYFKICSYFTEMKHLTGNDGIFNVFIIWLMLLELYFLMLIFYFKIWIPNVTLSIRTIIEGKVHTD